MHGSSPSTTQFLLLRESNFPEIFRDSIIGKSTKDMSKDCHSEDDFDSDEDRVTNGRKQLLDSFEAALKDFKRAGKSQLKLENLQEKPFPAETPCSTF